MDIAVILIHIYFCVIHHIIDLDIYIYIYIVRYYSQKKRNSWKSKVRYYNTTIQDHVICFFYNCSPQFYIGIFLWMLFNLCTVFFCSCCCYTFLYLHQSHSFGQKRKCFSLLLFLFLVELEREQRGVLINLYK